MLEYPGELATLLTCNLYTTWHQKRWLTNDLRSVWQWNGHELKAYLNYYQQWKFYNQRFNKCFDAVWPNRLKSKSHYRSCTWAAESGGKIGGTVTYGKATHVELIVTAGRGGRNRYYPAGVGQNASESHAELPGATSVNRCSVVYANAINVSYLCKVCKFSSVSIFTRHDCGVPVASCEEVWSESQTKEPVWLARYWAGFLACCCEWGLGWRCLQTLGKGNCKWMSAGKQYVWWWRAPEKLPVVCVHQCMTHKIRRVVVESGEHYGWFALWLVHGGAGGQTCGVLKDAIMVVESGPHEEHYGWFMEEQEDQLVEFRRML